ncbi:MAG: Fur family transcriptional regulator [Ilumatobacteraceae bacterium]
MKAHDDSVHHQVAQRLHGSGLKYTAGRRQLVDLLLQHGRPASVPELLKKRPRLTQSSMYRNLADLEQMEIIHKVSGNDDHARYELTEEFIGHHHHLICVRCGDIDDFVVTASTERALDGALVQAARAAKFTVSGHRLDALGICARCKR